MKYLDPKLHEIGMWSVAVLINTNNWKEFQSNWLVICRTFFSWHKNTLSHLNCHYDALFDRISKIKGDPTLCTSINITHDSSSEMNDVFSFDDEEELLYNGKPQISYESVKGRRRPLISRVSSLNLYLRFNGMAGS